MVVFEKNIVEARLDVLIGFAHELDEFWLNATRAPEHPRTSVDLAAQDFLGRHHALLASLYFFDLKFLYRFFVNSRTQAIWWNHLPTL
jgi:hypothetical protein